jgi:glycosyltransferase involved in cell wall biosynthesis
MARIQIVNPLPMRWESLYTEALNGHEVEWTRHGPFNGNDLTVFMWADENTKRWIETVSGKKIVFVRRYEYYSDLESFAWNKVDAVVFVNPWLAEGFEERTGVKPHVIPNSVDLSKWTFRERGPGNKIAMVGFVNQKKNLPLAFQIMAALPRDYSLHVIGEVQDGATVDYLMNLGDSLGIKATFYNPTDDVDGFLEDKNYLLNTAISEGCPNNVIEAMAKGIFPVIHNWPGASMLFDEHWVFRTVDQARNIIMSNGVPGYSKIVRNFTENHFGPSNMVAFRSLVDEVLAR